MTIRPLFLPGVVCLSLWLPGGDSSLSGQQQVDKQDVAGDRTGSIERLAMRVRVLRCEPAAESLVVSWRRGGEGLGGDVIRGSFLPAASNASSANQTDPEAVPNISSGEWTAWLPVESIVGRAKGWMFPTVTVAYPLVGRKRPDPPQSIRVAFQFARDEHVFREFSEEAPRGATVGFAFPASLWDQRGIQNEDFVHSLNGLRGHAQARRERLEQRFPDPFTPPAQFGLLGHLGGYGEGPGDGKGKASGYGVRHCDPAIVEEECRTLRLLGINGLVGSESLHLVDAAGVGQQFRRVFWGGPGSGSPMAAVSSKSAGEPDGCPFDPRLGPLMAERTAEAIAEHQASGAAERWGLWWDEIGVAVKGHLNDCDRCRDAYCEYLRQQGVSPREVGCQDWSEVKPFELWHVESSGTSVKQVMAPPPPDVGGRRCYYYTQRFMTYATAQLFPASAAAMKSAGVRLYAMQGPTPSWSGHSLDWHEFYDHGANTALVWETSNRDPRAWQWESYLADIMRGIARRHQLPIGCLVKPHRGAPQQRMLSVVTRGTQVVEWYTYGPDYAKGDSFSQSPVLLEEVAQAGRFLARAEPYLYGVHWAQEPEVAFVSPRSSEIWGRAGELGVTAFEDAKWVYLALRHAHVPVDILSEQQLAEGPAALDRYKVLYVVGPNLHRDAAEQVARWVERGGTLWTDALGLSRDEANEPSAINQKLGVGPRRYESWGSVPAYRATTLEPIVETNRPAAAQIVWGDGAAGEAGSCVAAAGRELLQSADARVSARFADDVPAMVERRHGQGRIVVAGFWAGLTYSARLRRADYDMAADLDATLRRWIAAPAMAAGIRRPAAPANPWVEAVVLEKDDRRIIALINWNYAPAAARMGSEAGQLVELADLRIDLPDWAQVGRWRSLESGELPTRQDNTGPFVVLPRLKAIDLLVEE